MALKLNCLEPLTAVGIGIGACALAPIDAGLTAGAVIGGAGLFARIRENMRKSGLDDAALIQRLQKTILREWDKWDATAETRDAATVADAAMTRLLPLVMMTREELAATATRAADEAYPVHAARLLVDRLADHDAIFAASATDAPPSLHRAFALDVIERALRAAKSDPQYAQLLTLDIAIELGRAMAETMAAVAEVGRRVDEGFAAVQLALAGTSDADRLSVQALRGAVARFIAFRPHASVSEIVDAVESFVPEYQALTARVAALDAHDNQLKGAQQAAAEALEDGDLDAGRRHLAEVTQIRLDVAESATRDAAQTLDELAHAHMLALDWSGANAVWNRAAALLLPYDAGAAEDMLAAAARQFLAQGTRVSDRVLLDTAIEHMRRLQLAALTRQDSVLAARYTNNLANALKKQGERTGGDEGLHRLAEAVAAYRDALTIHTRYAMPVQWAMTMNNLANALKLQGERTGGDEGLDLLAQAVTAYRDALAIRTRDAMPVQWATTMNNLANALKLQGERTGGGEGLGLLAEAIAAYRDALAIRTRDAMPAPWATIMNNLANALKTQGKRTAGEEGLHLFTEAVAALRDALTIRTRDAMPVQWAMTMNNLANALKTQGERIGGSEGLRLLAEAIAAYRDALIIRTREAMPVQWAMTMHNLAIVYEALADAGADVRGHLRAAEDALCDALTVYTREHMPYFHGRAVTGLARVRDKLAALGG
jgi:tetratricopeptide (TPR) repeat protein